MEESRKRTKMGGDDDDQIGGASTSQNEPPLASDDLDAASKIAELQAEIEKMRVENEVLVDAQNRVKALAIEMKAGNECMKALVIEVKDQYKLETDALKSKNEDLKSALQWAYTTERIPRQHWLDMGHDEEYADAIEVLLNSLKRIIQSLRLGTLVSESIDIDFDHQDGDGDYIKAVHDDLLLPYWKEFAAALKHWSEYYAGEEKSLNVVIQDIEVPKAVLDVLRPSFEQSRLKGVLFFGSGHPGDMADFVKKVLQTNHCITEIAFGAIMFYQEDMETICSAFKWRIDIDEFQLGKCFIDGIDTQKLEKILTTTNAVGSKGMSLRLNENGMSSREAAVIAEFLSSDPTLFHLDVSKNRFNDPDAAVLANALSNNNNLGSLIVDNNMIRENGRLAFLRTIFDVSSLSSCAASNHSCRIHGLEKDISALNRYGDVISNKWDKIFAMLALSCGDSLINTALLLGVPAQLIPALLEKTNGEYDGDSPLLTDLYLELTNAQRCQKHDTWDNLGKTKSLSCVYELMRSWVVPLIFA